MERRTSDKYRLIECVHKNPILWNSSLPNFKGAEKEKSTTWETIGSAFNVSGRRAERAFKSLRESYRRELTCKKQFGESYSSKWEFFNAMDFLRTVIRERKQMPLKSSKNGSLDQLNRSSPQFDEYSYFVHPGDNSNNGVTSTDDNVNNTFDEDTNDISARSKSTSGHVKSEPAADNIGDMSAFDDGDDDYPFPEITLDDDPVPPKKKRKLADESIGEQFHPQSYHYQPENVYRTPREMLHGKFCDYISAKLNTLNDGNADELMNKILLLFVKN